nr:hypothetical protein [Paenibacillus sp. P13VS]
MVKVYTLIIERKQVLGKLVQTHWPKELVVLHGLRIIPSELCFQGFDRVLRIAARFNSPLYLRYEQIVKLQKRIKAGIAILQPVNGVFLMDICHSATLKIERVITTEIVSKNRKLSFFKP